MTTIVINVSEGDLATTGGGCLFHILTSFTQWTVLLSPNYCEGAGRFSSVPAFLLIFQNIQLFNIIFLLSTYDILH